MLLLCYTDRVHRALLSFPTRRSSDLVVQPQLHTDMSDFSDRFGVAMPGGAQEALDPSPRLTRDRNQKREIHNTVGIDLDHRVVRSEEHTSELQSRFDLVCRLLLEKKN